MKSFFPYFRHVREPHSPYHSPFPLIFCSCPDFQVKNVETLAICKLDCEQSLFYLSNRGEECDKRASMTVSVMCKQQCHKLLLAWALKDPVQHRCHSHAPTLSLFCFFPPILEEKRDCLQSICKLHFFNIL